MTNLPLTIEELLTYGNFTATEREAIYREITKSILTKRQREMMSCYITRKKGWFQ